MQANMLKQAAKPLVARRAVATRSTISTVGRVLKKAHFIEVPKLSESGAKVMLLNVAVEDPTMLRGETGYYPTSTQTFSQIINNQAQEDFWNSVGPGSIVNAVANWGVNSIQPSKDPQYPPSVNLRAQQIDVVVLKNPTA